MFSHYRYTVICFVILFLHLPKSEANDEAIQLGLRQVDLSSDLNGWVPVTQSKLINYGEWITTGGGGGGGVPNGWGGIWEQTTTLVWEDFKTVTSNRFERAVLSDGNNGLRVRSIEPFVPSNATRYTQQVINSYIVSPRIDLSKNNQDHLLFQYKSNSYFTLNLWLGKNDGSYWHSVWEEGQNLNPNHVTTRFVGNGFREVKINLENALMDLNLWLTNNGFTNDVISPQTNRIYINFVAKDNANRWSGTSTLKYLRLNRSGLQVIMAKVNPSKPPSIPSSALTIKIIASLSSGELAKLTNCREARTSKSGRYHTHLLLPAIQKLIQSPIF